MVKYFISFLMLISLGASAQRMTSQVKLVHYALESFQDAKVKLKSGQVYAQKMNYNLLTKEMIFEQNGKYLAIANPQDMDSIDFGKRTFVPGDHAFYEYVRGGSLPFFIEYTATIKEQGAQTGYGTTNTAATTSYSALLNTGGAYELKLPDEFTVMPGRNYYVRKDGQLQKFTNESQLSKILPEKKDKIKSLVSASHTSFSKPAEVAALIQQL